MLLHSRMDRVRNEEVRGEGAVEMKNDRVDHKVLKIFGYVDHMSEEQMS